MISFHLFGLVLLIFAWEIITSNAFDCSKECYNRPKKFQMCGSDFKTYGDKCRLQKAQCTNKGLHMLHRGKCKSWENQTTQCFDEAEECKHITKQSGMCNRFPKLKKKCRWTCESCKCEDTKNCDDVTEELCDKMADVFHKTCAKTCNICGEGKNEKMWKKPVKDDQKDENT